MVSSASISCMTIAALVAVVLPVGLFFGLRKRLGLRVVPMLVGAAVFIVFAVILEGQIVHPLVLRPDENGVIGLLATNPAAFVAYGALAAGVFEETGRLVGFTLLKQRFAGVRTAVSYGIGHGGMEVILVLGLGMVSNITLAMLINTGASEQVFAGLPADQAAAIVQALTQTPPQMFLLGIVERIFALIVQLSLSVLVWVAVTHADRRWLFPLAIVLHALVDVPPACAQAGLLSVTWVEIILVPSALVLGAYALWWLRRCLGEERLAVDAAH